MIRPRSNDNRDEYALETPVIATPHLPGTVVAAPDVDQLIDLVAVDLVTHAMNCVRTFGDFHLALSGGSTPEPLYERLMYDPDYRQLPWRRTHLWIVDERCVPFDDDRSNFRMIRETIVDHADIPPEQVHPMQVSLPTADIEYERHLREALGWREKGQDRLDYVLLGMGADGHVASLFPHTEPLRDAERFVRFNTAPVEPVERLTMTFTLINAARLIAVMVAGSAKAETIRRVGRAEEPVDTIPIRGVQPLSGELKWYLDAAACGEDARTD